MKENTQEKNIVTVNEDSIFYKIKSFFRNLFHKNKTMEKTNVEAVAENNTEQEESAKKAFVENLKNIENDETLLLKLQKQYRSGEIKEEELTEEQKKALCSLYDDQIEKLKKSNALRKSKILEYRKAMMANN